ncbi:MAG: SDR family oxidoreductase [Verrucomicrobia bacterium]|nr:SDR family oxidoreductase [Verrucomicrobiota bacterium]
MGHFVIFGATGGIGSKLCELLTAQKHQVTLAVRSEDKGKMLAQKLRQEYHIVDFSNSRSVQQGLEQIVAKFGEIDGIANCIGSLFLKPLHLTTDEEWHTVLTANLTYAFYILKAACPYFEKKKKGSIVMLSSAAAQIGLANHEAIGAAKAGLIGLTRAAAASYAPSHLRINVVAPGLVNTPLTAALTSNEASMKTSVSMHPLGRIGEPDDIAHAIAWLLGGEASWITGQVLTVDGGLSSLKLRSAP